MKLKTKKALAKRVKLTGTGKIKRYKAGKSHLLTKKSKIKKQFLRHSTLVNKSFKSAIKKFLPYS